MVAVRICSVESRGMDKSMSGTDMRTWLPGANLMTYKQLGDAVKRGATLDDVLGPHGILVLLYLVGDSYGHWTIVFRRGRDVVECFDSYGYTPDDEFKFIPKGIRERTNQDYRHLTKLLYKSPYRIEYNEVPLQAETPGVATCGRHCIARYAFKDMSIAAYQKCFKPYDMDAVVTVAVPNRP